VWIFSFSLLNIFWASSLVLATNLEEIRSRGVLRVGMSGDYAPFCVCHASSDDCSGFEVEVARRFAADLGVPLAIVQFRWPELRRDLEAEKFDIAMSGITIRPERLFFANFSIPYAVGGAVILIADKERLSSVATINQAGVRLAVNAGGHLEQIARTRFEKATILPTPRNRELPTLVETQQADALLSDSFEAPQFLAKHDRLAALPAFGRDRKAYLLRRSDAELQNFLDDWLLDRESDGFLPGLRHRWFGENKPPSFSPLGQIFALLDLRLALMPAVAAYKYLHSLPVEDLAQEEQVLENATTLARKSGQNSEAFQELFRVQIDLSKQVQQLVLRDLEHIPKWAMARDLHLEIRPLLAKISDQLIKLLARPLSSSVTQAEMMQMAGEEISAEGVTSEGKQRLGKAVWFAATRRSSGG